MIKPYNPPESPEARKEAARLREVMQLEARVETAYTQRNNAAVALVRMAFLLGWRAGRGFMEAGNGEPGTPSEGVLKLSAGDFDPVEVERLMRDVPVGDMVQLIQLSSTAWPKRAYLDPPSSLRLGLPEYTPVPKAPFPPGVCACPKCEQPREAGRLFCMPHRSVALREASGNLGGPRALIASLTPRDGEQQ